MRAIDFGYCEYRFGVTRKGKPMIKCKLTGDVKKTKDCLDCPVKLNDLSQVLHKL